MVKELDSIIDIDGAKYGISANKVANKLTIGGKSYDGSSAIEITAADLALDGLDGAVISTRTITTGDGLTGGGDLSADRTISVSVGNGIIIDNDKVTAKPGNGIIVDSTGINHADTSSQTSVTASGRRYITGVTLDNYGHVTGLTTGTETSSGTGTDTNQKVKAGNITFGVNDEINFVEGSNVTITGNAADKTITISATGGDGGNSDYAEYAEYANKIQVNMEHTAPYVAITISSKDPSPEAEVGEIWFKY